MKNYTSFFIAILGVFSVNGFAQPIDSIPGNTKMENTLLIADEDVAIVSYRVEERINMAFGGSVTTYEVSNLSLISTNDLGKNNTRIITPKYANTKVKAAVTVNIEQPKVPLNTMTVTAEPIQMLTAVPKEKKDYVNIDILSTYERVIDKGYKSVDMLKRVGNSRFFDGDLAMAAKWYTQLFELTTDLEPIYYYRYAQSLTSISELEKANEMMHIFENKNL